MEYQFYNWRLRRIAEDVYKILSALEYFNNIDYCELGGGRFKIKCNVNECVVFEKIIDGTDLIGYCQGADDKCVTHIVNNILLGTRKPMISGIIKTAS